MSIIVNDLHNSIANNIVNQSNNYYESFITLNLDAVKHNYSAIKSYLKENRVAGVIKSNAYGLGAKQVLNTLKQAGCTEIFVANLNEGIDARQYSKDTVIYVLHGHSNNLDVFIQYDLIPVIINQDQLEECRRYYESYAIKPSVVIHLDTGFNRNGLKLVSYANIDQSYIDIKMIMTHLSDASNMLSNNNNIQIERFNNIIKHYADIPSSLCATESILNKHIAYKYDVSRIGIGLYGYSCLTNLRPSVSLYAKVLSVTRVAKGEAVGYDCTYIAPKDILIASLAIGSADGIKHNFANKSFIMINNVKCYFIGKISMDSSVIDISQVAETVKPGDWINIFKCYDTFRYIIQDCITPGAFLAAMGQRVQRCYISDIL